jgi:D-alanyl-D-alanine carboxypeptidase
VARKSEFRARIAIACCALMAGVPAAAHSSEASTKSKTAMQLDECITEFIRSHADGASNSGGAIAIMRQDEVLLVRSFGFANLEWKVPAAADTRFRIWSLTKTFTATAVMMLAEQGKLGLDDPACDYLDGCPAEWRAIKIRHLLSNRSGLDDFTSEAQGGMPGSSYYRQKFKTFSKDPLFRAPVSETDALRTFQGAPLLSVPGTKYSYSNPGFFVLGLIISRATGLSYASALETLIFAPLGMRDSGVFSNDKLLERMAYGYVRDSDGQGGLAPPVPAPAIDYSWLGASAALYSTVGDLAKFNAAIDAGKLLPPSVWRKMMTPIESEDWGGYGLGFEIWNDPGGKYLGHIGAGPGFGSALYRYPSDGTAVIMLSTGLGLDNIIPQLRMIIAANGSASRKVLDQCSG